VVITKKSGRLSRVSETIFPTCWSHPIIISPSPDQATIMSVTVGDVVSFTAKGSSNNGEISRFQFQDLVGMSCTKVTKNDSSFCSFKPIPGQAGNLLSFCFYAYDVLGVRSSRRCFNLDVKSESIRKSFDIKNSNPLSSDYRL
jgi:hypothetical protein